MRWLFPFLIIVSCLTGAITGNMEAVTNTAMQAALDAVTLSFTLAASMALWNGFMEIASRAGLTHRLANLLTPLLSRLFAHPLSPQLKEAVACNLAANFMGLGNAATPLGLKAMEEFQKENPSRTDASDDMILFTVLNTASLQFFPGTIILLRFTAGSNAPTSIIPAVWGVSVLSVIAVILTVKFFSFITKRRVSHVQLDDSHSLCTGSDCGTMEKRELL